MVCEAGGSGPVFWTLARSATSVHGRPTSGGVPPGRSGKTSCSKSGSAVGVRFRRNRTELAPFHPQSSGAHEEAGTMDAVTSVPVPRNEPVRGYGPGSEERASLQRRLVELESTRHELTCTIAGEQRMARGERFEVVQPHDHGHVLGAPAHASR